MLYTLERGSDNENDNRTDDRKAQCIESKLLKAAYGDLIHPEAPTELCMHLFEGVQLLIRFPKDYPSRLAGFVISKNL
ncbi:unnamed protein product [Gongylonema pulchrum]|uniref:RWD domain-containing protein n=1 Tax=Gongylonema pulchrum TaxID=637853 RepID=A0A183ER60_9BILA|nr:unnamed protein product [Gongylonema pulchrum]